MHIRSSLVTLLLSSTTALALWDEYILAPRSRTLHPSSVYNVNGTVVDADSLASENAGSASFSGVSAVTYDFELNIAGLVTLEVGDVDSNECIGLTYTESSLWISGEGCDATQDSGIDEALWFCPSAPGNYSVSREHERGGFRYLSLISNTTGTIEITRITVQYTAMPHWPDDQLRNYSGYFHCDDELINRIWYAGAYTNQICTIDPNRGNSLVHLGVINSTMPGNSTPPQTWWLNYTIANGSSVFVDGAKRDRLVWPGDMAIAVPSIFVSTNDMSTVVDSLNALYARQKDDGQLPYAGVPFPVTYSATYHLYSLIGVADYYRFTGDLDYLQSKWDSWKRGLNFSLQFVDSSGMMNVTSSADWLRFGMGGHNIEANSIFYHTILQGVELGEVLGEDASVLQNWTSIAEGVKSAANRLLWNETAGLYHDNETTTLQPQDGNVWAVYSNLSDSAEKSTRISAGLAARWTEYGAPSPEADNAVSPFISSFELQMHALAGNVTAALDLMRLEWGYMLDGQYFTGSTFIEGYLANGELHYPPYSNDARISHAHGWATGPTSMLSFYVGGIHLTSAAGKTWEIAPRTGDLTFVDTGFTTELGRFSTRINSTSGGLITALTLTTPDGTSGDVNMPGTSGRLVSTTGASVSLTDGLAKNISGGTWSLVGSGNGTSTTGGNGTSTTPPVAYTGGASSYTLSFLGVVGGLAVLIL